MTTVIDFDPRTAKERAAEIVDQDLCGYDDMGPLDELHAQCFAALGPSPAAIAARLVEFGCKGTRPDEVDGEEYGDLAEPEECALAVYFREVCGATSASFGTDYGQLCWDGSNGIDEIGHEDVSLPQAIQDFQTGYQDFEYPELYVS